MQSKYGNTLFFILLYQLGRSFFCFLGFAVWSIIAWQFIEQGYLTQSIYEQLAVVVSFLCIFLFKKEKQYALIPYLTKLTVCKIRNYILLRDLFSGFNFILFPLIVPVLFLSKTIGDSTISCVFLFMGLWLTGLLLNILTRIIKYLHIKYMLFYIAILSIVIAYSIILVLFYRNATIFSYSDLFKNIYYIIAIVAGIILLIPSYFYVIKQNLYQVYEGNHISRKTFRDFNLRLISSNIFGKILLLKHLRCKVFRKFLVQMVSYIMAGVVFWGVFDLKIIGLGMFLGIYTFNVLPFTIYLNSNYFDGLYTKPVSIKSLLLNSFYIHIIMTSVLFIILLILITIFDKQLVLPLVSLYFYTSGPAALLLLQNVLFAQKFDLFPVQSDFTIQRTFAQKVIGIISTLSLFGCAAIIHFFSTIGCYIILLISMITLMTYSYWIHFLYEQFTKRRYQIMENLRKN